MKAKEMHIIKLFKHIRPFVVVLSVIFAIMSLFHPYFLLDDNQLLYLFSSMAQVSGGMFGLTLTAYVFFSDKIKEYGKNDETYYDAASKILKDLFQYLIIISILCGICLLFCIFGTVSLHKWNTLLNIIINESILFFGLTIIGILVFGCVLLSPSMLDMELAVLKSEAEERYKKIIIDSQNGDFGKFVRDYNLLERSINGIANHQTISPNINYSYRPI